MLNTRNLTDILYLPAWRFVFGHACPVSTHYIILTLINLKTVVLVVPLSLPSLLINSVAAHPHLRRCYAVALADRARKPT